MKTPLPKPKLPRTIEDYFDIHYNQVTKKDFLLKFIGSVQGTSKSTVFRHNFSVQLDARYIKASRDILKAELEKLRRETGDNEAYIVPTLEDLCETYVAQAMAKDDEFIERVKRWRDIGITPNRIHKFICKEKDCYYSDKDRDKSVDGKSMLSFNSLLTRIEHNDQARGELLGHPAMNYFDEADTFLMSKRIKFKDSGIFDKLYATKPELIKEDVFISLKFLQDRELLKAFRKEQDELSKTPESVDDNEFRLEELHKAIQILDFGYIMGLDKKRMTVDMCPQIVPLFRYVMEKDTRMVCGSATLRMDLIQRQRIIEYFNALRDDIAERMVQKSGMMGEISGQEMEEKADRIYHTELQYFEAPPPEGETQLYLYSIRDHSFSANRYSPKYDKSKSSGENHENAENFLKERFTEMEYHINQVNERMKALHGIDIEKKKVLVITYRRMVDYIQKRKENTHRHYERSILFRVDFQKWFSPDMHGTNAPDKGYEILILYGDPVTAPTVQFAHSLGLIPTGKKEIQKLRRGFALKEETSDFLRNMITTSALSEMFEGIHRARNNVIYPEHHEIQPKIPVIAISNLLDPDNEKDREIVINLLENDRIILHDLVKAYRTERKKEIEASTKSLLEELGLDLTTKKDENEG